MDEGDQPRGAEKQVGVVMNGFDSLFSTLDADPNRRGRQFEHLCRWFLLNDPIYRPQIRQVWLWDDWPGKWGADAGIDLVAETNDGSLWAIQAKAYNPNYSVKKADVDSFLSESGREDFFYRLLIATTDRIAGNATRAMRGQEKLTGQLMLSDLRRSDVVWPISIDDLRAPPQPTKTPRPHQQEAMDAIVAGFEGNDRGQLIMACGTGKTLVSLWISEKLGAQRTLVLVPSLSLLRQTIREWLVNTNRGFAYLPVCSDDTVRDKDSMVGHVSDLGFPATSDAEEIASFLKEPGPSVVFSTYQSSGAVALAMCDFDGEFELILADEAHRCAGPASSDFATVLDADLIRARRRLFMTATPRIFTGRIRREAKEADFEIASMDDEARFGRVFHRLSFGEAIDRELLSDYRVVIVGVDDALYRHYAESGRFVTRDGEEVTDARSLAAQIGLAKAQKDYDLRRTISFHSRVKSAKEFADSFPDVIQWIPEQDRPAGRVWTDHVHGNMNTSQRESRLDRMRHQTPDERSVLSNARCLSEGVDVPTLDGVAFIDPKRSEVDIVQAVGRAIRASDSKSFGTIVIPVFIDPTDDPLTALNDSRFKPIWDVIMALTGHDEQLGGELDELRRGLARSRDLHIPAKITLDLPESVSEGFVRAFETVLVEKTTARWEFWYGLLCVYVEHHGHADVPQRFTTENGDKLGSWISVTRLVTNEEGYDPERKKRLDDLGFVWDPLQVAWEEGYHRLLEYMEVHGHANVPQRFATEDGYRLGTWVSNQRQLVGRAGYDSERRKRLDDLGFVWDRLQAAWETGLDHLRWYVERNGHARVPGRFATDDGYQLGNWVFLQRQKEGYDPERRARLDSLGFVWNLRDSDRREAWEEGYHHLLEYMEVHGHANVPRKFITDDGYRLGTWVGTQRQSAKEEGYDPGHRARLDALGFIWSFFSVRRFAWETGFDYLRCYVERNGHARVPRTFVNEDGFRLGSWVHKERERAKGEGYDPERRARLDALGFVWDRLQAAWEVGYCHLLEYAERNGHANVPWNLITDDGYKLGTWLSNTKRLAKMNDYDPERRKRLNELGVVWDATVAGPANPDEQR